MTSVNNLSANADHEASVPEAPLPREGLLTLLFSVAVVLVIMNTAMFNLALPDVTEAFGITAASASWIVTGYSIMFSIASITYSRLSDFLPIRRLLVIGLLTLGLAVVAGFFQHQLYLPAYRTHSPGLGRGCSNVLVACPVYPLYPASPPWQSNGDNYVSRLTGSRAWAGCGRSHRRISRLDLAILCNGSYSASSAAVPYPAAQRSTHPWLL